MDSNESFFAQPTCSVQGTSPQLLEASKSQPGQMQRTSRSDLFRNLKQRLSSQRDSNANPASTISIARTSVQAVSTLSTQDLHVLENPRTLLDEHILPGLDQEIAAIAEAASRLQTEIPLYKKIRWCVVDQEKLAKFIEQLRKYNTGLRDVFPEDPQVQSCDHRPHVKVPFKMPLQLKIQRNKFVGREHLIIKLKENLSAEKERMNVVVLHGLGGIGKTQLAVELIYSSIEDYTSVFWISAASEEEAKQGFIEAAKCLIRHHACFITTSNHAPDYFLIASKLGMPGALDQKGNMPIDPSAMDEVIQAVRNWFAASGNENWLIVFDNYDDLESFDVNSYIPSCNHGAVIITSRRHDCAQQGRNRLEVNVMGKLEAVQLLLQSAGLTTEASTPESKLSYPPIQTT